MKNKECRSPHIVRWWCVNCQWWVDGRSCEYHQTAIFKCVNCGQFVTTLEKEVKKNDRNR